MAERIVELLWMHLRGNLFDRALPENPDALAVLHCRISSLSCFPEEGNGAPCDAPGGRLRFEKQFLGLQQITLLPGEREVRLQGSNMVTVPTDGSWVGCKMPFIFKEMQSGRGHRRIENGLRLDTHVGYAPSEGYAAAVWQKGTLLMMFRSGAWVGSHLVRFRFEENGVEVTHENGTSYRLRCRENIGNWQNCLSQTQVGLDLLFVGLLDWGVAGAAAATVIGQAVSLLFSVEFLRTNRETVGLETGGRLMEIDREILPRLVKLGIPYAVQSAAVNLSMIFVNTLVNQVGVYAASAFGAGTSKEN